MIYGGLLVAGLAAAAVVYMVLVHDVPGMRANRADTLKTALLVIGGSGALAGLYVAYRKQRTDEANHLRDQDKLFTERYTAAAAQLGSPAAAVRLAGVYALARIADDSERDRPTCLKVLCAYLRMPYDPDGPKFEPAERQVRLTAQTAIAERLRPAHPGFWPDARIDLTDAFLIDPDFRSITAEEFRAARATFGGTALFDGARFGGTASFDGTSFDGNAGFGGATFGRDARFLGATFGGDAKFDGATFGRDAWFGRVRFDGHAWFSKARFGREASFVGARFGRDAGFGDARFVSHAKFVDATFSWDVRFDKASFDWNAWFAGANFDGDAWFGGATFGGLAWFDKARFGRDVKFSEARFNNDPKFGKAKFDGRAEFDGARFHRNHPPSWPQGFAEPAGIVWVGPPASAVGPASVSGPDPNSPTDPAVPQAGS